MSKAKKYAKYCLIFSALYLVMGLIQEDPFLVCSATPFIVGTFILNAMDKEQ